MGEGVEQRGGSHGFGEDHAQERPEALLAEEVDRGVANTAVVQASFLTFVAQMQLLSLCSFSHGALGRHPLCGRVHPAVVLIVAQRQSSQLPEPLPLSLICPDDPAPRGLLLAGLNPAPPYPAMKRSTRHPELAGQIRKPPLVLRGRSRTEVAWPPATYRAQPETLEHFGDGLATQSPGLLGRTVAFAMQGFGYLCDGEFLCQEFADTLAQPG